MPGALVLTNSSSQLGPVTLTSITYHPSCASFDLACTSPEPGVFSLGAAAVGGPGTGCGDRVFTVGADGAGRYTFTASPAIVLAPPGSAGSNCTINFTFSVLRVPTTDAQPGTPGVQTTRSAIVSGTATANAGGAVNGSSRSIATITVLRAQPTITTQVSSSSVAQGSAITDTATVTGSPNVSVTGTVTFNLYGPNDTTCATIPVFTSTVALAGGTATSTSFAPVLPGTYRWRATYNGDTNNNSVSGVCNAANETVEVLPAGRYETLTPARILEPASASAASPVQSTRAPR